MYDINNNMSIKTKIKVMCLQSSIKNNELREIIFIYNKIDCIIYNESNYIINDKKYKMEICTSINYKNRYWNKIYISDDHNKFKLLIFLQIPSHETLNKLITKLIKEYNDTIYTITFINGNSNTKITYVNAYSETDIKNELSTMLLISEKYDNSRYWSHTLLQDRKKVKEDNRHIMKIINTKDINKKEAENIQLKINLLENTQEESKLLKRYHIKLTLGLDTLDATILKIYDYKYHIIYNFCALIDERNIYCTTDNTLDNLLYEVPIINKLINKLGYKNIFDNETLIKKNIFIKNIYALKNKNIFSKNEENYKIFKISEKRIKEMFNIDINNVQNILEYINTILLEYCLEITLERIQTNNIRKSYYKLNILNNVNEIIVYKINRGYKLYDINNIFIKPKILVYDHLINKDTKQIWLKKEIDGIMYFLR